MFRAVAVLMLFVASLAEASEQVVWQIGRPDRGYKELAIPGDHSAYGGRFLKTPPVFTAGTSRAERDWPFIHPGPADGWAGNRVHPFTKASACNLVEVAEQPLKVRGSTVAVPVGASGVATLLLE